MNPERDCVQQKLFIDPATLYVEARCAAARFDLTEFPRYMTYDDLLQECVYSILRQSHNPLVTKPGWRVNVMKNRLRDLRKRRQEESLCSDLEV